MTQKIIKVGNSAALTLPTQFLRESGLSIGDEMNVETNGKLKMVLAKPANDAAKSALTPEFKTWLDNFLSEYKPVLDELAHL
ncbi:AbrB/MazE/SpoVT family DNA-binding domain-containing protein [Candidatus Gottesmanbacteria bacterium]|nr:AbrB/MazE/SpoVT family DNA-binding domain-containing protein [Candidatus Gottesmanbacteria bacterium]